MRSYLKCNKLFFLINVLLITDCFSFMIIKNFLSRKMLMLLIYKTLPHYLADLLNFGVKLD